MDEPPEIEHWKRILVLGSGAFGIVSLWQHEDSHDCIAIKKCKFKTNIHVSERQRQRWENEVQIMQTLHCQNIVSFKPLPKELEVISLKYNPTKLPILSMEYCMKGNLRRVLTQVRNLSGLQEQEVRVVLADITNAVSYLHRQNITHRDIKPENIVLQHCPARPAEIIYKLIDLGYAKELSDSVVSFVGTLHYLAPEIMRSEQYDCSVDYWSLGVVAFEVICGILPFLPYYTPMERFSYIEKKKPEHICIYQLHSGSVAYSSELLKEHHISSCLKQNVEVWLRQALQFNPTLRGNDFSQGTNIFDYLLNVLEKKIVTVFSVHTLEFYSYEINDGILVSTLKDWIARDTRILKSDQVLLSNLEIYDITEDKYVVDILPLHDFNLFVFKKGAFINRENFKLPKYVTILFENCITKYKWRELKQLYVKSLFFLSQEEKMITSVKTAFKLCTCYIHSLNVKLKDNMQQVHKTVNNIMVKTDCYCNLHNNRQSKINCDYRDVYKIHLLKLQQLLVDLETCLHNANELIQNVEMLCKREDVLDGALTNVTPVIKSCDINKEIAKASELILKGGNTDDVTPREMVKIVSNALKEKDKLLNNKNFQSYSKAVLVAIRDVENLQTWMDGFHKHVKELSMAIDNNQREHYQNLLSLAQPKKKVSPFGASANHFVQCETSAVLNENLELRCQLEEILGQMFASHRRFCSELNLPSSQKL